MRNSFLLRLSAGDPGAGLPPGKTLEKADVVISLNGRDEGKRFLIVETQEYYSLLADGKGRRLEKPKRKKNKHVMLEGKADDQISAKLTGGEKVTNNDIRRALAKYTADHGENSLTERASPSIKRANSSHERVSSSSVRTKSPKGESGGI